MSQTITGTGSIAVINYSYNEQNRLISTITQANGVIDQVIYNYDNNGNMMSQSKERIEQEDSAVTSSFIMEKAGQSAAKDVTFYEYDIWNQLVQVTTGSQIMEYEYNGEGLRVAKAVNGEKT